MKRVSKFTQKMVVFVAKKQQTTKGASRFSPVILVPTIHGHKYMGIGRI